MAQPSSFMLQHNNISQINNNYYNLNINTKYLGYKYKFVNLFSILLRLILLKKTNLKIKILGLKLYLKLKKLKKPYKLKRKTFRYKFKRKLFLNVWNKIFKKLKLYFFNKNKYKFNIFIRTYFKKKLLPKLKIRRKRKFYWKIKKKNLRFLRRYKYKFSFSILRLLKIKNFTYIFFFLKKIKKRKYKKKGRWKMSKNYFLKRKMLTKKKMKIKRKLRIKLKLRLQKQKQTKKQKLLQNAKNVFIWNIYVLKKNYLNTLFRKIQTTRLILNLIFL